MIRGKHLLTGLRFSAAALAIGLACASAAEKAPPETPLTEVGQKLFERYSEMLKSLQAEIAEALPNIDEQKKAAFLKAYRCEAAATAAQLKALRAVSGKGGNETEKKNHEEARQALARATTDALSPVKATLEDLEAFLASDKLGAKLVKCAFLTEATPRGLAEFAQRGEAEEALVAKLLADDVLMKQMLVAGGAKNGKYGRAMQIYTDIQKASTKAGNGLLQRLALGVSLEHAVPLEQSNPQAGTDAPAIVEPVKRYLYYEKAWLDGELDPAFKDLTAWDYRMAVNSDAPDSVLTWGREMLRNYRPDHVYTTDFRWRYVAAVKTDVKYGSENVKDDLPNLQNYQNIIKNGGVCGRRAFFGRFILRCFGIPTVARPQKGHAALAHWTPDGWVVNLGAAWEWGWTEYGEGLDFAAHTQARKDERAYAQALRSQWVGDALGEKRAFGFHAAPSGFWSGVALYRQRAIIEGAKAVTLAPVGQDIGESNESKEKEVIQKAAIAEADRKILVSQDGAITIPAVACSRPAEGTGEIVCMKAFSGGTQLHSVRDFKVDRVLEYTFEAPRAGKYKLVAWVVTVQSDQKFLLTANDAKESVEIPVPYTVGRWEQTQPVEVTLVKGQNVLRFTRPAPSRGVTIKDFTLVPVK